VWSRCHTLRSPDHIRRRGPSRQGMIAFSKLRSLEYSALAKAKWETARVSANAQIIDMDILRTLPKDTSNVCMRSGTIRTEPMEQQSSNRAGLSLCTASRPTLRDVWEAYNRAHSPPRSTSLRMLLIFTSHSCKAQSKVMWARVSPCHRQTWTVDSGEAETRCRSLSRYRYQRHALWTV
jgi:hypothetical protein